MPETRSAGQFFVEQTGYSRSRPLRGPETFRQPAPYKRYPEVLGRIALPPPHREGGRGLWATIAARRSEREFSREALSLPEVSQLLWAVQGVTAEVSGFALRATASAGALYPNETYVFLLNVVGCPPGLAHYDVRGHALDLIAQGNFGHRLATACLGQTSCREAGVVFAWAAVIERGTSKYAERAYRYVFLDAGHLGAQLQLAATALGLGSVNIGAFFDDEVNALLGLDGVTEFAVYLTAVGKV